MSIWVKAMERVKKLESSTEESLGIEETVCMKSVVRNWRDPTHHRKVSRLYPANQDKSLNRPAGLRL